MTELEQQISQLREELRAEQVAHAATESACNAKQAILNAYRQDIAAKLLGLLERLEAKPCHCAGGNRCARCEAGVALRGYLGMPPEPDKSLEKTL